MIGITLALMNCTINIFLSNLLMLSVFHNDIKSTINIEIHSNPISILFVDIFICSNGAWESTDFFRFFNFVLNQDKNYEANKKSKCQWFKKRQIII